MDIENLVGSGRPALSDVVAARSAYLDLVGVGPLGQFVIACNRGCPIDVGCGWGPGCARYRLGVGRDGADWELLDVLETEGVSDRFSRVVIASGDGIFAPTAGRLATAGCEVTVVSRRASLSAQLSLAAKNVVYLADLDVVGVSVPVSAGSAA
ncbi:MULTISPECIES: NYN domain-containing protein [unclassified Modestobacter]